ncbi:unnamed protein product [Closterium sp. NIES-54]
MRCRIEDMAWNFIVCSWYEHGWCSLYGMAGAHCTAWHGARARARVMECCWCYCSWHGMVLVLVPVLMAWHVAGAGAHGMG